MDVATDGGFFNFILDEVGKVRYELDGFTMEATGAFFFNKFFINTTREGDGIFVSLDIEETFVVTEVEVGLGTVVSDKTFAVFDGIEQTGIDVEIGVAFLDGNFETFGLKNDTNAGGGDAFSYSGEDTSCNKNVFAVVLRFFGSHNAPSFRPR